MLLIRPAFWFLPEPRLTFCLVSCGPKLVPRFCVEVPDDFGGGAASDGAPSSPSCTVIVIAHLPIVCRRCYAQPILSSRYLFPVLCGSKTRMPGYGRLSAVPEAARQGNSGDDQRLSCGAARGRYLHGPDSVLHRNRGPGISITDRRMRWKHCCGRKGFAQRRRSESYSVRDRG